MSRAKHPLAEVQMATLRKGPRSETAKLWAVSWALKGRKRHRLGRVSAIAISTSPEGEVLVKCLTSRLDPATGKVVYDQVRMVHDLSSPAYPGARQRTLDPRERRDPAARKGDLPNADWLRLAIHVEQARRNMSHTPWNAAAVPQLPKIVARFGARLSPVATPAFAKVVSGRTGHDKNFVMGLSREQLSEKFQSLWDELWVPSPEGGYEIPLQYVPQAARTALCIYEDFSEMPTASINVSLPTVVRYPEKLQNICKADGVSAKDVLEVLAPQLSGQSAVAIDEIEAVYNTVVAGIQQADGCGEDAAVSQLEEWVTEYAKSGFAVPATPDAVRAALANQPLLQREATAAELAEAATTGVLHVSNVLAACVIAKAAVPEPFHVLPGADTPVEWNSGGYFAESPTRAKELVSA